MASRAEQKERARAAARRRTLTRLGIVAALAAVVVVVAAVAISSGGDDQPTADLATQSREVAELFDGIPQDAISLGSPDAPATLIEFADLQCPFCRDYATGVLPTVIDRYVRSGRVRLQLRVLTFIGDDSVRAGRVAAAASEQDRAWQFSDLFYRNQGQENSGFATDAFLRRIAEATPGLDADRALADADGQGCSG